MGILVCGWGQEGQGVGVGGGEADEPAAVAFGDEGLQGAAGGGFGVQDDGGAHAVVGEALKQLAGHAGAQVEEAVRQAGGGEQEAFGTLEVGVGQQLAGGVQGRQSGGVVGDDGDAGRAGMEGEAGFHGLRPAPVSPRPRRPWGPGPWV